MDSTTSGPILNPTPGFDPNDGGMSSGENLGEATGTPVIGLPQVDPSLFVTEQTLQTEQAVPAMNNDVNPATMVTPSIDTVATPSIDTMAMPGANIMASPSFDTTTPAIDTMTVPNIGGAMDGGIQQGAMPSAFGATDPITMPTPPKAPDPIEEELKAPLKAAAPVPGSIGSAISMPANGSQNATAPVDTSMFQKAGGKNTKTPSVAFNDPASQMAQNKPKAAKKKNNKTTMILLAVVGGMVVIALAAVLIMQLNS